MQNKINITRNIFDKKNAVEKIDYSSIFSGEISEPNFPEREVILTIIKYKSEEMYGKNSGNIKFEFILEDDDGNSLNQMFVLKSGKNNNFAKFIYQVLGYQPKEEIMLEDLEGKRIIATIAHYYNELGTGYANIAYCRPIEA